MVKPTSVSGAQIRAARLKAGLTQAALAQRIGTRERNIIRWENNQHEPRWEHVVAIAEATGLPLDFFRATPGRDRASASDAAA